MPTSTVKQENFIAYCENCAAKLPLRMIGKCCPKCGLVNLIEFELIPKREYPSLKL